MGKAFTSTLWERVTSRSASRLKIIDISGSPTEPYVEHCDGNKFRTYVWSPQPPAEHLTATVAGTELTGELLKRINGQAVSIRKSDSAKLALRVIINTGRKYVKYGFLK
jgi:hypothetical protein